MVGRPWSNGLGLRFHGLTRMCRVAVATGGMIPLITHSRVRGAQLGVSTWMLFLSKKMAGGALLKEGKARLLTHREGPSRQRTFTQTHCQNWEPPKRGRAETSPSPLLLPRGRW